MRTVAGIDCGLYGAISFIREGSASVLDVPSLSLMTGKSVKKNYDESGIREIFMSEMGPKGLIVFLEQQQAFPGQGGVSNFSCGRGYGFYRGLLVGLGISFQEVHPKRWQAMFFKGKIPQSKGAERKKHIKAISYQVASQLYPDLEFKGPNGGIKDGRSDSILLAEYGRRTGG